jgi:ATP-binding cassette subfamily F protein uup
MSFKDQHALKTLPVEIEALHARIAAHAAVLADPNLFTRDSKRFDAATAALAKDGAALAAAEQRWLELELLREEMEN